VRSRTDAGISVLELVVVLGIAAGFLVMVAASLPRPTVEARIDAAAIAAFLSEARTRVILSGEAGVLTVAQGSMTFGDKHIDWDTDLSVAASATRLSSDYRLIVYPDGSYSGSPLHVRSSGGTQPIPGVFRSGALND
jgi:Tfp pilus assembly protein FimT